MNLVQPAQPQLLGLGNAGVGHPLFPEEIAAAVGLTGPDELGDGVDELAEAALALPQGGVALLEGRGHLIERVGQEPQFTLLHLQTGPHRHVPGGQALGDALQSSYRADHQHFDAGQGRGHGKQRHQPQEHQVAPQDAVNRGHGPIHWEANGHV